MKDVNIKKQLPLHKKKSTFEAFFSGTILLFCAYTFFLLILTKGEQQGSIFFSGENSTDTFMDFFNVLKYTSTRDPYHYEALNGLWEKAYPPLAYLILYPFSRIYNYIDLSALSARGTQLGLMSILVFSIICIVPFSLLLYQNKSGSTLVKSTTVAALFSSGVFLFAIERGNLVIFAAFLLGIFIFFYNSERPLMREIAYFSLACAVGLKVTPVLFGVLLLKDKRWFASLRTIIYGVVVCFLPFLFFKGGFSNISQLLINVKLNTEYYKFLSPIYRLGFPSQYYAATYDASNTNTFVILGCVLLMLTAISCLGLTSRWKTSMFLSCAILVTPIVCGLYCALYLFAPIILFLNEKEHDKSDWLYVILFVAILNPFQFFWNTTPLTGLIVNTALLILYMLLLVEAIFASSLHMKKLFPKTIEQITHK